MSFFTMLERRVATIDSPLCVGLDPRFPAGTDVTERVLRDEASRIIEATHRYAAAFKPNIAFYEQYGGAGLDALAAIVGSVPDGIPVVLDAKRGDIGATAQAYATAVSRLGVHAVTVSPYMGPDSLAPFTAAGLGLFVLCRTSNPGGSTFQELDVSGRRLFERVAEAARDWDGEIGLVVAGNDTAALRDVRALRPEVWFLAPGIGAQGGAMDEAVASGFREDGMGLLPVVARGIANAPDAGAAARDYVDEFRRARDAWGRRPAADASTPRAPRTATGAASPPSASLLDAILDTGCFRVGEFTLKSGIVSPFYIDLRRIQSSPEALEAAAAAYEALLGRVACDRLAAVPVAALPLATALALRARLPLVYPRLPAKPHGTGNRIEGEWHAGERVVLVDDLITTGLSKLEAAALLREEGLVVEDLVVLVERGGGAAGETPTGGRAELADAGIRVHAAASVTDLVARARERGDISGGEAARVLGFLEQMG